MRKKSERGQVLVILAVSLVALISLIGLAVDGGRLWMVNAQAENIVNTACMNAAIALTQGNDGYAAFVTALSRYNISEDAYSPKVGEGWGLRQGYEETDQSIRTALSYTIPTTFLKIVGIDHLQVTAKERCTMTSALITPIAVKQSAFDASISSGSAVDVVGLGSEADIDPGTAYRGVVFPFIWCINGLGSADSNCPYIRIFDPLIETPPSPQTAKNVLMSNCWSGKCNKVWAPVGTRLPIVAGTSANQLCKAAAESGLIPGTTFVAMIYDGEVVRPDPSFGPWENVGVIGYATFTVTDLSPNNVNCNSMSAVATGGIYTSFSEIPLELFPREIPWDATGGW